MIADPLIDEEGIVYGEIDLGECVLPKQYQDIIGHYNRFDIFELRVNRRPLSPVRMLDEIATQGSADTSPEEGWSQSEDLPVQNEGASGESRADFSASPTPIPSA